MLRNVGRLDSLTHSIDGAPSDADQAFKFNNPYWVSRNDVPKWYEPPIFPDQSSMLIRTMILILSYSNARTASLL